MLWTPGNTTRLRRVASFERINSLLDTLISICLRPLVRVSIVVEARLVDARFVREQKLQATRASWAAAFLVRLSRRLRLVVRDVRQDLLFARYAKLHPIHYGPKGRGYMSLAAYSAHERSERYRTQRSRLQPFVDLFPDLLRFNDGDSFLEMGCGSGQNIRMLAEGYPSSRIVGYDINDEAVELVRDFESHCGVEVETGDLTDGVFRSTVLKESFDHIILSHVFSLICAQSSGLTADLRRNIILDLARACRTSLVVIDTFGFSGPPTMTIEQRQRAIVSDDVLAYLTGIDTGRTVLLQVNNLRAVVFMKEELDLGQSR